MLVSYDKGFLEAPQMQRSTGNTDLDVGFEAVPEPLLICLLL